MAKRRNEKAAENLHEKLFIWAQSNQLLQDPYVSNLLEALKEQRNLAFWAALSPVDYLPSPAVSLKARKVIEYAALIRNILIFMPVALTWTAVGRATTAFQIYNQQNPNNLSNFLDFWQNGYGVLDDFWRLSHIAGLDAILIGIIILLIVFIHFQNRSLSALESARRFQLENERFTLALALSEYLFGKRAISDIKIRDSVANAITNLLKSTSDINKTTRELTKLSKESSLTKIINQLKRSNRETLGFDDSLPRRFKI